MANIPAALPAFFMVTVAASCGWHIFPYQGDDAEWADAEHQIQSLADIEGTWRNADASLILSYTAGDATAFLSINGGTPIPAALQDLTRGTPLAGGEFLVYWDTQTGAGEWVMVCIRDDYRIIVFINRATNEERTDTLRKTG
ncbi:MAG: hypothetical protein LBD37_04945 [Treponema sp.]|jgi:hypothetical protein|nr:hypothetical protein [Treponema sp.]